MTFEEFNNLDPVLAKKELKRCCGSKRWAGLMLEARPFDSLDDVKQNAARINAILEDLDWLDAFGHHPKIGDVGKLRERFASTAEWSAGEQSAVVVADEEIIRDLKNLNDEYYDRFGFIFIVCATGKSAGEMLEILKSRIDNDQQTELRNAAEEQKKITQIRLEKLFS